MGATYVIGDVHGCFDTLQTLWPRLGFDPGRDRLWLVGDLVNRGPRSLDVLRWARRMADRLGDRMVVVLGNHDVHLLARHHGWSKKRRRDTLETVLAAPDRDELVEWLARRPLAHRDGDVLMVHAGLRPGWSAEETVTRARRAERVLRDPERRRALVDRAVDPPPELAAPRADLQTMINLRTLGRSDGPRNGGPRNGGPCDDFKGHPDEAPAGCIPWYTHPQRKTADNVVVFGHWAALGLHLSPDAIGLDTGCVWGRQLTALRLDDRTIFQQPALEPG